MQSGPHRPNSFMLQLVALISGERPAPSLKHTLEACGEAAHASASSSLRIDVTRRDSTSSSHPRSSALRGPRLYLCSAVAFVLMPSTVVAGRASIAAAQASVAH